MKEKSRLTVEELKEFLDYDPATGRFVWIKATSKNRRWLIGRTAGTIAPTGYIVIKVWGTHYLAHRLAWLYMTGCWPDHHIDHRNGQRAENSWANIRKGGYVLNAQNRPPRAGSKYGLKGVVYVGDRCRRKPFAAKIGANGKTYYLGYFKTAEAAHEAYCKAAERLHGDYARVA